MTATPAPAQDRAAVAIAFLQAGPEATREELLAIAAGDPDAVVTFDSNGAHLVSCAAAPSLLECLRASIGPVRQMALYTVMHICACYLLSR